MYTGALLSPPDERDYPASAALDISGVNIPDNYEVWQPPVENQGRIGNCVAQSLANIMECIAHNYGEEHKDFSVGYIYGMSTVDGTGMYARDACAALLKEGDVLREIWECLEENPACKEKRQAVGDDIKEQAQRVLAYVRLKTKEEMQAFILKYNLPVMLIARTGAFHSWYENSDGRHATVGYGWCSEGVYRTEVGIHEEYRDIKFTNSWGTGYHYKGRGYCKFEDMSEIWGIVPVDKITLTDIEGSWAKQDIRYLANLGIVTGYEDNTFKPKQPITREEMAAMIARTIRYLKK